MHIGDRHDGRLNTITRRSPHPESEGGQENPGRGVGHGEHNVIKTRAERGRAQRARARASPLSLRGSPPLEGRFLEFLRINSYGG